MKAKLTKKGYTILKESLSGNKLQELKKELTVSPIVIPDYPSPIKPYPVYYENNRKIYLPRFYAQKEFGHLNTSFPETEKWNEDVVFTGTIRTNQKIPIKNTITELRRNGGAILCLLAGQGKTVCALKLMSLIKKKTLIVVHKSFLLDQWIERIQQFIPNAKVGIIQGKRFDVENKDIVMCMLQSICYHKYEQHKFDLFNMVVIDECHHMSAKTFSQALPKVASKYMLGLTATPSRDDGLTKVFKWYLGDISFISSQDKRYGKVKRLNYNNNAFVEKYNRMGKLCRATMLNKLCVDRVRNNLLIEFISSISEKESRQILLLSDRRSHLQFFFESLNNNSIGFYVGGMKKKDLKISESKQIILATYSMAKEALDIKSLNTLILATPISKLGQAVPRILRQENPELTPLVVDLCDNYSIFQRQSMRRLQYFKKCHWKIIDYYYDGPIFQKKIEYQYGKGDKKGKKNKVNKPHKLLLNDSDE